MRPNKRQRALLQQARGCGIPEVDAEHGDRRVLWIMQAKGWINFIRVEESFAFVTSRSGLAALREPAPPPPPGRVGCVNPICGRTEAQEKFPGCTSIICDACFKQVPDLRREFRELWASYRKVERAARRRGEAKTSRALWIIGRRIDANWRAIEAAFTAPEKPEGLEQFLKEVGFDEE